MPYGYMVELHILGHQKFRYENTLPYGCGGADKRMVKASTGTLNLNGSRQAGSTHRLTTGHLAGPAYGSRGIQKPPAREWQGLALISGRSSRFTCHLFNGDVETLSCTLLPECNHRSAINFESVRPAIAINSQQFRTYAVLRRDNNSTTSANRDLNEH